MLLQVYGIHLTDPTVVNVSYSFISNIFIYCNRVEWSLINLFNSLEKYFLLRGRRQIFKMCCRKIKALDHSTSLDHLKKRKDCFREGIMNGPEMYKAHSGCDGNNFSDPSL